MSVRPAVQLAIFDLANNISEDCGFWISQMFCGSAAIVSSLNPGIEFCSPKESENRRSERKSTPMNRSDTSSECRERWARSIVSAWEEIA